MRKKNGIKKPFIIIQTLATSYNEHELTDIRNYWLQKGADKVMIKSILVTKPDNLHLLPINQKFRRNNYVKLKIQNCFRMWHTAVVTWDGRVVPCCFDKDAEYNLGDTNENSFSSIWRNKNYNGFRESMKDHINMPEMCKNCTERKGKIFINQ